MSAPEQKNAIWKSESGSFEIRTFGLLEDARPALDEVVATGASVHLEQMDHDSWWMGIEAAGRYFHLWFTLEGGHLCVRLSDQNEDAE